MQHTAHVLIISKQDGTDKGYYVGIQDSKVITTGYLSEATLFSPKDKIHIDMQLLKLLDYEVELFRIGHISLIANP